MNNNIRFFHTSKTYVNSIIINKVLINTYLLLSSTILFSAFMTFISIKYNSKPIGFFSMLVIYFGLLFAINFFKRSILSLFFVFLLTGFMGYCIGPAINHVFSMKNGAQILFMSLSLTGLMFFSLSFYAFITKKNFNFLNNFLFIGSIVIILCVFLNLFLHINLLSVLISGFFIIFSSGMILYEISSIINNGETDYINVTISLYLSLYNIFLSLLNILGISNND